jgi:hypothetical protein
MVPDAGRRDDDSMVNDWTWWLTAAAKIVVWG